MRIADSDDESSSPDDESCVGAGLKNLNNSCYLNAVLQCLTHTVYLLQKLRCYKYPDPCNCGNDMFCVLRALEEHIESALSTSERCAISPLAFIENLKYFSADFRRGQQEDADEFLQAFLDRLDRCCTDGELDNLVQLTFGGHLFSGFRCCECKHFSTTSENCLGLRLELEDADSLQSALALFTRVEKVGMTCDNCGKKVSKKKQFKLDIVPEVVAFQLKRFTQNGDNMVKICKHVAFPLEIDLKPYMPRRPDNEKVITNYYLYAFVEHIGSSVASGHYLSYVRSDKTTWHRFDDEQVDRIDEDTVLSKDAYILFYARETVPWFSSWRQSVASGSQSPNSVLDGTSGKCTSESSCENIGKQCDDSPDVERGANCDDDSVHHLMVRDQDSSQKQQDGIFQLQVEELATTKNQEKDEPCKPEPSIREETKAAVDG